MYASLLNSLTDHWNLWIVSATLLVAAVIDGYKLKVPNWITFPMILSGIVVNTVLGGWGGLGASLLGVVVGMAPLMALYAIGGMGAGDVKLFGGVGAWMLPQMTFIAFLGGAVIGGVIGFVMMIVSGRMQHHLNQMSLIATEIVTIGDPRVLSAIAAKRKPSMLLLPYGIPLMLGTIAYFVWAAVA